MNENIRKALAEIRGQATELEIILEEDAPALFATSAIQVALKAIQEEADAIEQQNL